MKKHTLLFILTCCFVSFAYSQDNDTLVMKKNAIRDVYGVVKIKGSDISLTNANISVIGSDFKTQTDSQGGFVIPNVKDDIKIAITAKNFVKSEYIISSDTDVVMFSLEPDPIVYASFQSGGLGDIPMAMLSEGSNFIKLDPDKPYNLTSLYYRLGTLPGVLVTSSGVNIRGSVSTAVNDAGSRSLTQKSSLLIMIDGVRYANDGSKTAITDAFDLAGVDDIATITVLKGADRAIYGFAGSDGVIIITTRSYLISKMLLNAEKEVKRAEDYKRREAKRIAKQNEKDSTLLK